MSDTLNVSSGLKEILQCIVVTCFGVLSLYLMDYAFVENSLFWSFTHLVVLGSGVLVVYFGFIWLVDVLFGFNIHNHYLVKAPKM